MSSKQTGSLDEMEARAFRFGHSVAIFDIVEWLRGDEAEAVRADAMMAMVPPEDALAQMIEEGKPWRPVPE